MREIPPIEDQTELYLLDGVGPARLYPVIDAELDRRPDIVRDNSNLGVGAITMHARATNVCVGQDK